eukprot:TRINITY_DN10354_c0_g1_i1.p1 TRINITY_DN10354_c0_g1~~TRINITY_DN10354_c0_g1_i1.p1  ORF type:complete len:495 (+),score=95.41 TRINITY_DN10354_c0_g1_i1:58-1542(+)
MTDWYIFADLPLDIWHDIFRHLGSLGLNAVLRVCKQWNMIASDDFMWEGFFRELGQPASLWKLDQFSWKTTFEHCHGYVMLETLFMMSMNDYRSLVEWRLGVACSDAAVICESWKSIRRMIGKPALKLCSATGIIPLVVSCLQNSVAAVQFEACWTLTNLCLDSAIALRCVDAGAVPALKQLLLHSDVECVHQAMWALSNLAGVNQVACEALLTENIFSAVCAILSEALEQPATLPDTLRQQLMAIRLLGNICQKAAVPLTAQKAHCVFEPLKQLLASLLESQASDLAYLLSGLGAGGSGMIAALQHSGVLMAATEAMMTSRCVVFERAVHELLGAALKEQDLLLPADVIPMLVRLLQRTNRSARKQTCQLVAQLALNSPHLAIDSELLDVLKVCLLERMFDVMVVIAQVCVYVSLHPDGIARLLQVDILQSLCVVFTVPNGVIRALLELFEQVAAVDREYIRNALIEEDMAVVLQGLASKSDLHAAIRLAELL